MKAPITSGMRLDSAGVAFTERIVTPRVALTVAEHLALDLGRHVLVVLADLTPLRGSAPGLAARGEVPSRRGYPGYLYSNPASLLERAGGINGVAGSITQLPVLTMPSGDAHYQAGRHDVAEDPTG